MSFAGGESLTHHPVIQSFNELRAIDASMGPLGFQEFSKKKPIAHDVNGYKHRNPTLIKIVEALDALFLACTAGGLDNYSIAIKNGGVELVTSVCATFKTGGEQLLTSSVKVLGFLLQGMSMLCSLHCDRILLSHHILFYQLSDNLYAFLQISKALKSFDKVVGLIFLWKCSMNIITKETLLNIVVQLWQQLPLEMRSLRKHSWK